MKRILLIAALLVPRLLTWAAEPSIFPEGFSGPVYNFIELYVAEAAAEAADAKAGKHAERTLEEKLTQDGVIVEGGTILDLPAKVAAEGPLTAPGGAPLTVNVATRMWRHYRVEWRDTLGNQVFALAFPIDHLLLTRQTADAREARLLASLRGLAAPQDLAPRDPNILLATLNSRMVPASLTIEETDEESVDEVVPDEEVAAPENEAEADTLVTEPPVPAEPLLVEGDCLFTPDINTHLYISPVDSLPVASPQRYPVETLSNILTTAEIPNDLSLDLTHIGLDRERTRLRIPLNSLLAMFREQGCTLFFGLSDISPEGRYTCLLMANNAPEGYCHSMRLRLSTETLENLSGTVDARLSAYIPVSRILSLFDENAQ